MVAGSVPARATRWLAWLAWSTSALGIPTGCTADFPPLAEDSGSGGDTDADIDGDTDADTDTDSGSGVDTGTCGESVWDGNFTIDSPGDLNNFSGTTEITGNLNICGTSLTDLTGLECLTVIGGHLRIDDLPDLESLDGLQSLTTVGDYLRIYDNPSLNTILHLVSLAEIGLTSDLSIFSNPLLPNCEAEDLRDRLVSNGWQGDESFWGNDEDAVCEE